MPSVEQQFSGFLLLLDRFQKQLAEFMLGAYLACDFGSDSGDDGDSALSPQVRLDVVDGSPQVTLDHAITWMDLTRDQELSEYRLAVTLTFTGAGVAVEAFVRLDLDRDMGEWPAGVHVPYRQRADGLGLDEALAFVEARVEEMCRRYDDVAGLGLTRREATSKGPSSEAHARAARAGLGASRVHGGDQSTEDSKPEWDWRFGE